MSVVAFERKPVTGVWSESELNTIVAALNTALAPATGREWETGTTENGDAQFYLLGPLPDQACELCLSRIGRRYILEDGCGPAAVRASKPRSRRTAREGGGPVHVVAYGSRDHVVVCGPERAFDEKLEPMLAETEDLLVQLAPQLASFA